MDRNFDWETCLLLTVAPSQFKDDTEHQNIHMEVLQLWQGSHWARIHLQTKSTVQEGTQGGRVDS